MSIVHDWRPRHNPWVVAMTVTMATFMEVLDTSIANVSLPHIAGDLSVGQDESTWVLTSYLVSNAVVLPLSGWLSTVIGRKRFYMSCVALFTLSSLLCGLAPNLTTLIVCRVVQGAGGGGLQPSEQAILADTFAPERRGMAFAVYGMAVVLAPAIGPTLGGYITDNFSWRWIFFVNVPIGMASIALSSRVLEDPPWARRRGGLHIDYVGLALIAAGIGSLQVVLDKGERDDWFASPLITWLAINSAACLVAAAIWEWLAARPIVEVRLFRARNFAIATVLMFMLGVVLFGTTVLLPLYLQTLMGYTAQLAGETLSPGGLAVLLLLPLVGRLSSRVDARWLIAFGFVATALALFHMTAIHPGIDFKTAMLYRIYQSIGLAFLFVPISTIAYVGVPPEKNHQVSSIMNLARNLGGGVGISLATTLIARRSQVHHNVLVGHIGALDPLARRTIEQLRALISRRGFGPAESTRRAYAQLYRELVRQSAALAYIDTLFLLGALCVCLLPLVFLLRRSQPGAAVAH
jgi:DHA2 family multidrug resistance protein